VRGSDPKTPPGRGNKHGWTKVTIISEGTGFSGANLKEPFVKIRKKVEDGLADTGPETILNRKGLDPRKECRESLLKTSPSTP